MDNLSFDTMTEGPSAPPETIVKQGGNSEISDDEMVAFGSDDSQPKEKVKKELATKLDAKTREEKDAKSEGKQAARAVEKEAASQELKAKLLKIKHGDTEMDLAEDAMVPVKVNGEVVQVPVKDLLANYSGKTDWTKKYQDLHEERKTFYTERDSVNTRVNDMYRMAVEDKNPRMAIESLAEAMGADPTEMWANLITPIREAFKSVPSMSPEDLERHERETELEYYKSKENYRKQDAEKARETQALTSRIDTVRDQYGITPEQFRGAYDEMVQEARRLKFDENELTPEMVGQYHQLMNKQTQVAQFVTETYKDSEKLSEINEQLLEVWKQNPTFKLDDLKEIAADVFGSPKAKSARIAEKIKQTKTTEKRLPQFEPSSWDDL